MKLSITIKPEFAVTAETMRRLVESGLAGEQIRHAAEILHRGDILLTWNNPHHPGTKYFAGLPPKQTKPSKP